MYKTISTIILSLTVSIVYAQITGPELLEKTINYHDPSGNWSDLNAKIFLQQTRPNGPTRESELTLKTIRHTSN